MILSHVEFHEHTVLLDSRKEQPFPILGTCIYCGRTRAVTLLTTEHIIPDGLRGTLTLPESSCVRCAKHINETIEQEAINNHFGMARLAMDIKSSKRRGKSSKRSSSYRTYNYSGGTEGATEHEASSDMPHFIALEVTGKPPALLTGIGYHASLSSFHISGRNGIPPGRSLISPKFSTGKFPRMAAKIAYAYAVATLGYGTFRPLVLDYINSVGFEGLPRYIGSYDPVSRPPNTLHKISLAIEKLDTFPLPNFPSVKRNLVIVRIELFLPYLLPIIEVITGEI